MKNDTKTTISGSGKNLEGAEWSNLKAGYCPLCDGELEEIEGMYKCTECNFRISWQRFNELTYNDES